ncbi:MAG: FMN-binding protein [Lachnospiraceae bacterium]|nr:FMN-binding protein [Lachnospiraceae bacterium]
MLLGILFHIVIYWMDFQAYRRRIDCIHLQEITIPSLADGEYVGEYDAGYIYAKVKVTISNGRIQELSLLEHRNERGQAAEQVLADIELTQEFPVDAVSGATNSSKVIQKAVENALMGGQ